MATKQFKQFKQLKDHKRYEISTQGEVRNIASGKLLSRNKNSTGYSRVSLYSDSARKYKQCLLHRLVAFTYLEVIEDKPHINHKDGNKSNNSVCNLEYCSREDNMVHAYKTGLKKRQLSNEQVTEIREKLRLADQRIGAQLAREYGVSVSMISLIKKGYKYKS